MDIFFTCWSHFFLNSPYTCTILQHSYTYPLPQSYIYHIVAQQYIPVYKCIFHYHTATHSTLPHNFTFLHQPHCHTVIHTLLSHSYTLIHILWYHTFLHIQHCHTCNYILCYRKYPSTWLRYASPGHSIYDS